MKSRWGWKRNQEAVTELAATGGGIERRANLDGVMTVIVNNGDVVHDAASMSKRRPTPANFTRVPSRIKSLGTFR